MPGLTHLYIGEEAVAVGVCSALRQRRLHHAAPTAATAIASRKAPTSAGCSPSCSARRPATAAARAARCTSPTTRTATSARTRSSAAPPGIATGAAFSAKRRGTDQVAVCFFGEGALGQGLVYEVMNMAALWTLPVIYVCENNLYNEYTHYLEATAGDILDRPRAFGIEARRGRRPGRPRGLRRGDRARRACARAAAARHSCSATPTATTAITSATSTARTTARRTEEELWRGERDPLALLGRWLVEQRLADDDDAASAIEDEARDGDRAGLAFALDAPYPDPSRGDRGCLRLASRRLPATRELTFAQAVNEALAEELRRDDDACS